MEQSADIFRLDAVQPESSEVRLALLELSALLLLLNLYNREFEGVLVLLNNLQPLEALAMVKAPGRVTAAVTKLFATF